MKIRYVLIYEDLPDDHPNWPNERVYRIKDTKTGIISLSCYVDKAKAQKRVDGKNETVSN